MVGYMGMGVEELVVLLVVDNFVDKLGIVWMGWGQDGVYQIRDEVGEFRFNLGVDLKRWIMQKIGLSELARDDL